MRELQACQADCDNEDRGKKGDKQLAAAGQESNNGGGMERDDRTEIDRGPSDSKRRPKIKIEGGVNTKRTATMKGNKSKITRP